MTNTCHEKVEAVISLIQERSKRPDLLEIIKVPVTVKIPAGSVSQIRCKVNIYMDNPEQTRHFILNNNDNWGEELIFSETIGKISKGRNQSIFIEVKNPTKNEIVLKKRKEIGTINCVTAVIPMKIKNVAAKNPGRSIMGCTVRVEQKISESIDKATISESSKKWVPNVDLFHLNDKQRILVEKMLREECDVFSRSNCDIGDIQDFGMKINLKDDIPVKEAYRHMPRNLYDEVKNYINDLLVNWWVRESFSAYASPIVCVQKKDGSLRMCVDYRRLNKKTIPDSQPLPRIQDILDNLNSQEWFSTLDMSKAYHLAEECRHMTAFFYAMGIV